MDTKTRPPALVIIDAQDDSFRYDAGTRLVAERIPPVMSAFRSVGGTVYTVYIAYEGDEMRDIGASIVVPQPGDVIGFKTTQCPFEHGATQPCTRPWAESAGERVSYEGKPSLEAALKARNHGKIVVCGFETDKCALAAIEGGLRRQFNMILATDLTSTRASKHTRETLRAIEKHSRFPMMDSTEIVRKIRDKGP